MKQKMGLAERSSAIGNRGRGFGLEAKERDGREAPASKHPFSNRLRGSLRSGDTAGTGREDGRDAPSSKLDGTGEEAAK